MTGRRGVRARHRGGHFLRVTRGLRTRSEALKVRSAERIPEFTKKYVLAVAGEGGGVLVCGTNTNKFADRRHVRSLAE